RGPSERVQTAMRTAIASGRGGLGTIYVWAGGNGAEESDDNSNYDGYANMPETIAVGAIDDAGVRSYYSEPGANLLIAAPSSGGSLGITTTNYRGIGEDTNDDDVLEYPFEPYT